MNPRQRQYDKLGETLVKKLEQRGYEACYCATREEALAKAKALIPEDHVVSWGGSATMAETGILDYVRKNRRCIDRDTGTTPEERQELMRKGLLCDTYLMSANAISCQGEIVNIDGNGNRCAAMIFGPRQVILVAGMNKVTRDLPSALARARSTAATINIRRFPAAKTPCQATGICGDCLAPDSICNYVVVTRRCNPTEKIKVILVGEDLGF